jgi:hypothetical protein
LCHSYLAHAVHTHGTLSLPSQQSCRSSSTIVPLLRLSGPHATRGDAHDKYPRAPPSAPDQGKQPSDEDPKPETQPCSRATRRQFAKSARRNADASCSQTTPICAEMGCSQRQNTVMGRRHLHTRPWPPGRTTTGLQPRHRTFLTTLCGQDNNGRGHCAGTRPCWRKREAHVSHTCEKSCALHQQGCNRYLPCTLCSTD